MSNRSFRVTFLESGRHATLVYPGHTPYDAERDFTTDHPGARVLSVLEDTIGVVQMGDPDGDVDFFRG